jgi:DNA modification methylase
MDWRHIGEMLSAGCLSFGDLVNLCVWVKPTGGMGKLYRSRHELCFLFSNGDKNYIDNVELGKHGRYRTNCWEYEAVGSFGSHKKDIKLHPTVKPYEMVKDIILDASPRDGIVLDSFIGSGTTIIAAEKSKRVCYGIEIEPKYVDTAIRRFQDLFKIDAIHAETGRTYNDMLNDVKKQEMKK